MNTWLCAKVAVVYNYRGDLYACVLKEADGALQFNQILHVLLYRFLLFQLV